MRILITGSEGLVGRALGTALRAAGHTIVGADLRGTDPVDVRDASAVAERISSCDGVVQLAAVSRVAWGEDDPETTWSTNVEGTRTVLEASSRPWVLFASSREVYGQPPEGVRVTEEAPLAPLNVYGRSKVAGEAMVLAERARRAASVVRLSNIYGTTDDHGDRVVPAFARAAVEGAELRVDGLDNAFDFVHLDDAVAGLVRIVERLGAGRPPPTVHLVTGRSTTLGALARLAVACAGTEARLREARARTFDVATFHGDPARAQAELGWSAKVSIEAGMARLVRAFGG
ncbi:MAG: NAD(P)-dependent oxidoreductase [Myxococcota bacterium]